MMVSATATAATGRSTEKGMSSFFPRRRRRH